MFSESICPFVFLTGAHLHCPYNHTQNHCINKRHSKKAICKEQTRQLSSNGEKDTYHSQIPCYKLLEDRETGIIILPTPGREKKHKHLQHIHPLLFQLVRTFSLLSTEFTKIFQTQIIHLRQSIRSENQSNPRKNEKCPNIQEV